MLLKKIKVTYTSPKAPEPITEEVEEVVVEEEPKPKAKRKAKKLAEPAQAESYNDWVAPLMDWARGKGYQVERSELSFRVDITPYAEEEGWRAVILHHMEDALDLSIFFGFNTPEHTKSIEFNRVPVAQAINALEYLFRGKDIYNA